ncbi:glutamine-dependent NAD(+) synthetase-like [Ylistrum balloti]|uniref:glutamine-dependent NAD(+) synthetase-like n=1 Tax=Ylistrum balloti TaxID=509963 RepID=UPI002905E512|nr:glutamine-dependent NAD(+) synthetase-like [Ylistrum balloti]
MRITFAQTNPTIASIEENSVAISKIIAKHSSTDLFIFPELAVTGYKPLDFLYMDSFFDRISNAVAAIQASLHEEASLIIGLPYLSSGKRSGKQPQKEDLSAEHCLQDTFFLSQQRTETVFNIAMYCSRAKQEGMQAKRALPSYDVFFERRYFEAAHTTKVFSCHGMRFCVLICEDLWSPMEPGHPVYDACSLALDFIVVISASPYQIQKEEKRKELARVLSTTAQCPLIYCNMVGGNDELVFDGNSFVLSDKGITLMQLSHCSVDVGSLVLRKEQGSVVLHPEASETTGIVTQNTTAEVRTHTGELRSYEGACSSLEQRTNSTIASSYYSKQEDLARLVPVLELGLRDYLLKLQLPLQVHLGISGGIDSAVVAYLAAKSIGPERVCGIMLPSQYTSSESWEDALQLIERLQIKKYIVSISEITACIEKHITDVFPPSPRGVSEENIQARVRGLILMAYSNKYASTLLTTGNKSELAVGYATLYGDMCGTLNIIGDLYKTEVFHLAEHINSTKEHIPRRILHKAPSAELRENQTDQDSLPPYSVLDDILYAFINEYKSPEQLIHEGKHAPAVIQNIWQLYCKAEFKRRQAAPIIKVSSTAFGRGRFVPLVHKL